MNMKKGQISIEVLAIIAILVIGSIIAGVYYINTIEKYKQNSSDLEIDFDIEDFDQDPITTPENPTPNDPTPEEIYFNNLSLSIRPTGEIKTGVNFYIKATAEANTPEVKINKILIKNSSNMLTDECKILNKTITQTGTYENVDVLNLGTTDNYYKEFTVNCRTADTYNFEFSGKYEEITHTANINKTITETTVPLNYYFNSLNAELIPPIITPMEENFEIKVFADSNSPSVYISKVKIYKKDFNEYLLTNKCNSTSGIYVSTGTYENLNYLNNSQEDYYFNNFNFNCEIDGDYKFEFEGEFETETHIAIINKKIESNYPFLYPDNLFSFQSTYYNSLYSSNYLDLDGEKFAKEKFGNTENIEYSWWYKYISDINSLEPTYEEITPYIYTDNFLNNLNLLDIKQHNNWILKSNNEKVFDTTQIYWGNTNLGRHKVMLNIYNSETNEQYNKEYKQFYRFYYAGEEGGGPTIIKTPVILVPENKQVSGEYFGITIISEYDLNINKNNFVINYEKPSNLEIEFKKKFYIENGYKNNLLGYYFLGKYSGNAPTDPVNVNITIEGSDDKEPYVDLKTIETNFKYIIYNKSDIETPTISIENYTSTPQQFADKFRQSIDISANRIETEDYYINQKITLLPNIENLDTNEFNCQILLNNTNISNNCELPINLKFKSFGEQNITFKLNYFNFRSGTYEEIETNKIINIANKEFSANIKKPNNKEYFNYLENVSFELEKNIAESYNNIDWFISGINKFANVESINNLEEFSESDLDENLTEIANSYPEIKGINNKEFQIINIYQDPNNDVGYDKVNFNKINNTNNLDVASYFITPSQSKAYDNTIIKLKGYNCKAEEFGGGWGSIEVLSSMYFKNSSESYYCNPESVSVAKNCLWNINSNIIEDSDCSLDLNTSQLNHGFNTISLNSEDLSGNNYQTPDTNFVVLPRAIFSDFILSDNGQKNINFNINIKDISESEYYLFVINQPGSQYTPLGLVEITNSGNYTVNIQNNYFNGFYCDDFDYQLNLYYYLGNPEEEVNLNIPQGTGPYYEQVPNRALIDIIDESSYICE